MECRWPTVAVFGTVDLDHRASVFEAVSGLKMADATGWMEEGQRVDSQAPLEPDSDMAEKPKTPFRRLVIRPTPTSCGPAGGMQSKEKRSAQKGQ